MKKLTVKEASEFLGITREAIYNRIRRGSLQSSTQNNIKYVLIDEEQSPIKTQNLVQTGFSSEYEEYLKEQIQELKEELKNSKEKIEELYRQKDEQIKSFLQLSFQSTTQKQVVPKESFDGIIDADIKPQKEWISLKKLLKKRNLSKEKRAWIEKKLSKKVGKSKHIKMKNNKLFVNENKKFKDIYEE